MSADLDKASVLERFIGFYDELDLAIEQVDVDRIAELVDARGPVVEALVDAFDGERLPDALRLRVIDSEARLRAAMVQIHDALFRSLSNQRRVAYAVGRYDAAAR